MNAHCAHWRSNYFMQAGREVEIDGMDEWCCKCNQAVGFDDSGDICPGDSEEIK